MDVLFELVENKKMLHLQHIAPFDKLPKTQVFILEVPHYITIIC